MGGNLILTRHVGERIYIGDDIIITVVEIRRSDGPLKVRLGIQAPREVPIMRKELLDEQEKTDDGRPN